MKENKYLKVFTWLLYLIYIGSLAFFIIKKEYMYIGITLFCLISTIILRMCNKKINNLVNNNLYVVLVAFILFSSLLGTCYNFYDINHYDDFLHFWSGIIACSVGLSIIDFFNTPKQIRDMSKVFIVIFLLMFGVAVGGFWEIMEFGIDNILGMHTQAGGLNDTMIDMIDGLLGTIVMMPFAMKKISRY